MRKKTAQKPKEILLGPDLPYQKTSERKDRGAIYIMRHACPASWPDRTICAGFYYGFVTTVTKKCDFYHNLEVDSRGSMTEEM